MIFSVFGEPLSLDLFLFFRAANVFETVVSSDMMLKLRWSDTDNYYMNMGVDTGKLAFTAWRNELSASVIR